MLKERRSADRYGVVQWFADGRRVGAVRNRRATLALAIPLVLAAGVGAVVLSANHSSVRPELAASVSKLRAHHPPPLPMPPGNTGDAGSNCNIIVPANPLTARGLATPYQLSGPGCTMTNPDTRAFVQATIINPATGKLSVYEPLVVDQGTTPAAPPVMPRLPRGAVVTIDFGFNGDNLTQVAGHRTRHHHRAGTNALQQANCVNGTQGSIFGQVSYCNATAFFNATNKAIGAGTLTIPALGTGTDGQPCPTTRSFAMVDQDQSDNVTSRYLLTPNGQTAQDNAANTARLGGASVLTNGSDDGLLDNYLDPAVGCTPFTAPDLSNAGTNGTSQALNELQAAAYQKAPIALVPVNDPMTEIDGAFSIDKTNLYRAGVDQPALPADTDTNANAQQYCQNMLTTQVASLQVDQAAFVNGPTPDSETGNNLFTFLAARLSGSFDSLSCGDFGMTNPVHLTTDGDGVAIDATFGDGASPSPSGTASATASDTASPTTSGGSPTPSATPPGPSAPPSTPPPSSSAPTTTPGEAATP